MACAINRPSAHEQVLQLGDICGLVEAKFRSWRVGPDAVVNGPHFGLRPPGLQPHFHQ